MKLIDKQVNRLVGKYLKLSDFTIPAVGQSFSTASLSTEINLVLAGLVDGLGNDLQNTEGGTDIVAGLACPLEKLGEIRVHATQDPLKDDANNSEVHCLISKRSVSVGLANITGFETEFISYNAPADAANNQIRYVNATTSLEYSTDGGSNWGALVDVSAASDTDCFKLNDNGASSFIVVRKTSAAVPVADQSDTLTVSNVNYNLGMFSWVSGGYTPYYNTELISVDFGLPVVAQWEAILPSDELTELGGKFMDVVSGSGSEKLVTFIHTVSAQNTVDDLPSISAYVAKHTLEVNGIDLVYGATEEYDISGSTITFIPANVGYNIETTDKVVSKYFRV